MYFFYVSEMAVLLQLVLLFSVGATACCGLWRMKEWPSLVCVLSKKRINYYIKFHVKS